MNAVRNDVEKLVSVELEAANQQFRQFASAHEGYAVILEELDEVETEHDLLKAEIRQSMWGRVKNNHKIEDDDIWYTLDHAINLAVEAIQVAAMLRKFQHGQDNGWLERLKERSADDAKVKSSGWISVRDALPEKDGDHIVMDEDGDAFIMTFNAHEKSFGSWGGHYDGDTWVVDSWGEYPVTHWLPIPKMPEEC